MKKILLGLFTVFTLVTLVACGNIKIDDHTVVISKMYGAQYMDNNVIELYNNSDKPVNLRAYKLSFYANGSSTITDSFKLKGTIKPNSYVSIGSKNLDKELNIKLDVKLSKNLPYNGNDAVALTYNDKAIDTVGHVGLDYEFSKNITLIRLGEKSSYKPNDTYDRFSFIEYLPEVFKYLKNDNYQIKTLEDLYKGPRLELHYKNTPYSRNNMGTGGAPEATLAGIADGDTATFNFEGKPAAGSHRYYYINTAEKAGPNTEDEPWGEIGTKYNKDYLLNDSQNKEIRIQSVPGGTVTDTYGRNLGLVWINDQLSQFLIVSEGLSRVFSASYNETNLALSYNDVPYLTFLLYAEKRAKDNGWGMHGTNNAPDWNYDTNSRAPESAWNDWTPHLEINW